MKILIVSYYFPPLNSIASFRPFSWAQSWSLSGHSVTVLTIEKCHSFGGSQYAGNAQFDVYEVKKPKLSNLMRPEVARAADDHNSLPKSPSMKRVLRVILNPIIRFLSSRGINQSCRFPDVDDYWIKGALDWAKKNGPWTTAVCTVGPYSTLYIGYKLKQLKLISTLVADYRDLWTNNRHYKGLFPFSLIENYMEKKMLKAVDSLVTVSDGFSNKLVNKYHFLRNVICTIRNGYDSFLNQENTQSFSHTSKTKIRIIYTGSIYYPIQDPIILFELITELGEKGLLDNLEVIFIGPNHKSLERLVSKFKISRWVKFLGFLSRKETSTWQERADILLIIESQSNSDDGVIPAKVFEYLSKKKEIWVLGVNEEKELGRIVKEADAGILFHNDKAKLKQELLNLVRGPRNNFKFSDAVIRSHDRQVLASRYLDLVKSLNDPN